MLGVSAAGGVLFSSIVSMPALQKMCPSVRVACMSESQMFLWLFFFCQDKVNTKARECHEVLRKSYKHMAEYIKLVRQL